MLGGGDEVVVELCQSMQCTCEYSCVLRMYCGIVVTMYECLFVDNSHPHKRHTSTFYANTLWQILVLVSFVTTAVEGIL